MKCPVCDGVTLREVEKSGVLIDVCPSCKGVWLDRGELEKLMQSLNETHAEFEQLQSQAASQHLRAPNDQFYNPNEQRANQAPYSQQSYGHEQANYQQPNYQQQNYQQPIYQQQQQPYYKDGHKHSDNKYGYDKYGRPYKKKKKTVFSVFEDLFD